MELNLGAGRRGGQALYNPNSKRVFPPGEHVAWFLVKDCDERPGVPNWGLASMHSMIACGCAACTLPTGLASVADVVPLLGQ